jgi:hypothetical protein
MVNASEGVMRRRRQTLPTLAICPQDRRQAQKGNGSWPGLPRESQAALNIEPGVKHRPNVAQNGYTERWNPLAALRLCRSR